MTEEVRSFHITEIHYRDYFGRLLWIESMVLRRLFGPGDEVINDSKKYTVRRVAVADNIQHVNFNLDD